MRKRILAILLCGTMLLGVVGCGAGEVQSQNLMEDMTAQNPEDAADSGNNVTVGGEDISDEEKSADGGAEELSAKASPIADFGVSLLQTTLKNEDSDENVLVSPLSVIMALAMTANGAEGETKAQMEAVIGTDLNDYLRDYRLGLETNENSKLHLANAIWFRDLEGLNVKKNFLQTNADYYNAAAYKAAFDKSTLKDINQWVKKNTDGMIEEIIKDISPEAAMYLVNALSFDAEWSSIYKENQIKDGIFTKEDGTEQKADMMYSTERRYLEDDFATGFMKYYKNQEYAFVALLPKEGVSVADYVDSLTGEHLTELLVNAQSLEVKTMVPKFETEYSVTLNDVLMQMGMTDAFDKELADFSAMADIPEDWNIYISNVIHKTFISVDEKGTKAGAATVVAANYGTTSVQIEESKIVYLDRPFVYLLIDCANNEPFFIGTMMDVKK